MCYCQFNYSVSVIVHTEKYMTCSVKKEALVPPEIKGLVQTFTTLEIKSVCYLDMLAKSNPQIRA